MTSSNGQVIERAEGENNMTALKCRESYGERGFAVDSDIKRLPQGN